MLNRFLLLAARRAANDPRLRAKAADLYRERAKPVIDRKVADIREVASQTDPRRKPAYFAGRVVRRLLDG